MRSIADRLGISYRTVAFHKYGMMRKAGLMTNAELLNFAFRRGIFERPTVVNWSNDEESR